MTKQVTITEATKILGITKPALYWHIRNGLKTYNNGKEYTAKRTLGEVITTTTLEDMKKYFIKQYKAERPHSLYYLMQIYEAMLRAEKE